VILVDTSVWVDHLNDNATLQVRTLRQLVGRQRLLVGDLILCEVLQGLRSDGEAAIVEQAMRRFNVVSLTNPELAVRAAANYRFLRGKGVTVRKTIDVLIGSFCIAHGHALLHDDRDFEPMRSYLGLHTI
jgi:predicted nucleic acid-binding protein